MQYPKGTQAFRGANTISLDKIRMFIRIKLDSKSSKNQPFLKNSTYFPIDDDATIKTLKCKIQEYVNVAAENQEIRTLTKSFIDSRKVKDLCYTRGSSIMLYSHEADFCKHRESVPYFICFLQVFINESNLQQRELDHTHLLALPKDKANESSPNSSTSSVTLMAESDAESSDNESESTLSNSDAGTSVESNNSKLLSDRRKRKSHIERIDQKRPRDSPDLDRLSSTLCKYLDEFPKSQKDVEKNYSDDNNSDESDNPNALENIRDSNKSVDWNVGHDKIRDTSEVNESPSSLSTYVDEDPKSSEKTEQKLSDIQQTGVENHIYSKSLSTSVVLDKIIPWETQQPVQNTPSNSSATYTQEKRDIIGIQSSILSTTSDFCHPCTIIDPIFREFALIISNNAHDINKTECRNLLEWFFNRFRNCDNSSQLQFLNHAAITHFEGRLWIACMNTDTCEWVISNISKYPLHSYNVESLNTGHHLCEVVVPNMVSKENNLLDIFELLEKQNPNLSTIKWCVSNRRFLAGDEKDYNELAVSALCTNELLHISVDSETKQFLDGVDKKLKYCFWHIVFKFVNV